MKASIYIAVAAATANTVMALPPVMHAWQPNPSFSLSWPLAAPVPTSNTDWQPAHDQVCFYLTNDMQWQGYGVNLCNVNGQCSPKVSDGLDRNITSAGGNAGQVCFLYSEQNCTGESSVPIKFPGYEYLGEIQFDNTARSWMCTKQSVVNPISTSTVTVAPVPATTLSSTTTVTTTVSSIHSSILFPVPTPLSGPDLSSTFATSSVPSFVFDPPATTSALAANPKPRAALPKQDSIRPVSAYTTSSPMCTRKYPQPTYVATAWRWTTTWLNEYYPCTSAGNP